MSTSAARMDSVRQAYSAAAEQPREKHPFPIGRAFAASLGYPLETLESLPREAVDAFSGVSTVADFAEIERGWTILDIGCGAGLDSLVAARKTGPAGRVIGVDFSAPMLERARKAAIESGATRVSFIQSSATCLPLPDNSVDASLINGIFNLNPDRAAIFSELGRVVKKGGRVWAAELVLTGPLSTAEREDDSNWFA